MKKQINQLAANLRYLRQQKNLSQESLAEQIGVTRQAVAKWETGASFPDIIKCDALAELYNVDLNDLIHFDAAKHDFPIGPKGKYIFGTVTVGERGQIVLPKKARVTLQIKTGASLVVLGDTNPGTTGLALIDSNQFIRQTSTKFAQSIITPPTGDANHD